MASADVREAVHQLVDVLAITLGSILLRTSIGSQFVDHDVGEIRESRRHGKNGPNQPRIRPAKLIDEAAVDGPRIGNNRLARVGSLCARKLRLRLYRVKVRNA